MSVRTSWKSLLPFPWEAIALATLAEAVDLLTGALLVGLTEGFLEVLVLRAIQSRIVD